MNRARLSHITSLTSFGIILVVFGHSFPTAQLEKGFLNVLLGRMHQTVYAFHMPLFIFISGYLFAYTTQSRTHIDYLAFVRKKALRLLVPYVLISSAAFPVKLLLSHYAWRSGTGLKSFLMGLLFPSQNVIFFFWFLPMLFVIFLVAPQLHRALISPNRNIAAPAVLIGLAALNVLLPTTSLDQRLHADIFGVSIAAMMAVYFWLGALACLFKDRLNFLDNGFVALAGLAGLVACNILLPAVVGWAPPDTHDFLSTAGFRLLCFLAAVDGIAMSWSFIAVCERRGWAWTHPVDGWSYQIYLLSWFPQVFFRMVVFQMLRLGFLPAFLLMFAGGLFIPIVAAAWTRKLMPRLGWIIGMEKRSMADAREISPPSG